MTSLPDLRGKSLFWIVLAVVFAELIEFTLTPYLTLSSVSNLHVEMRAHSLFPFHLRHAVNLFEYWFSFHLQCAFNFWRCAYVNYRSASMFQWQWCFDFILSSFDLVYSDILFVMLFFFWFVKLPLMDHRNIYTNS